jgi:large subunit ribosomal protein L1
MKKFSKEYRKSLSQIEKDKSYTIEEAIALVKKISFEKFDSSIKLSVNLNLNTTHADQQLRGTIILPHGNGKVSKVLAILNSKDQEIAKKEKADYVGGVEMLDKIKNEN